MNDSGAHKRTSDLDAIRELKARYCMYVDTKDWDAWRDLFTTDLRTEGTRQAAGAARDEFVDGVRAVLSDVRTWHQAQSPVIEFTGPDTARGVWAMWDDLIFPPGHPWATAEHDRRCGYGHYEEEYRREDGRWRISFLRLARMWVWRSSSGPFVEGGIPSAGRAWLECGPG